MSSDKLLLNKKFWLQFVWAIIILILIFIGVKIALNKYTAHGDEISVPQFQNLYYNDIIESEYVDNFKFVIIDSIYDPLYVGGLVLDQTPKSGSKVKKGRKIYLTIASYTPTDVIMPDLTNVSLRQAMTILESTGLKLGKVTYEPSFDVNAVLRQLYNGVMISKGKEIPIGSVIDLIVGGDTEDKYSILPFLYGKKPKDARSVLVAAGLNIGEEFFVDSDNENLVKVYKTYPEWNKNKKLNFGDVVDIYYCTEDYMNLDSLIDAKSKLEPEPILNEDIDFDEDMDFDTAM